jgi:two-component system, NarL family, nitrate/nitrite response regulator NarL
MRVVLCDDHAMFLEALAHALGRLGHEVLGVAAGLDSVLELVSREQPDLCLLDLWFDGVSSLPVARAIRDEQPGVRIVLLTADADREAISALDQGAIDAIAGKEWTLDLIGQTLARVASGRPVRRLVGVRRSAGTRVHPRLTGREHQVLDLMASGASTVEIRRSLGISEHTVRSHIRHVLQKLGAHSRGEALRSARDQGILAGADVGRG